MWIRHEWARQKFDDRRGDLLRQVVLNSPYRGRCDDELVVHDVELLAKGADRVGPTHNFSTRPRDIGLTNICARAGVGEYVQRLLESSKILRADDYGDRSAIPGDSHPLVVLVDTIDHITEVASNISERLGGHVHNCATDARVRRAQFGRSHVRL